MKRVLIKVLRYWHTLRYLRPVQVVGRFFDGNDEEYKYHPEFGLSIERRKLVYPNSGVAPIKIITRIC